MAGKVGGRGIVLKRVGPKYGVVLDGDVKIVNKL